MSTCGKCGAESKGTSNYCKACGAELKAGALQDKKARIMARERKWVKPAVVVVAVAAILAGAWFGMNMYKMKKMAAGHLVLSAVRDASATAVNAGFVKAENGSIRIPLESVQDGQAHFFSYAATARNVRFFIMKAEDGSIRTAFDACIACNHAKLGYRQEKGVVVCNNCGMAFRPSEVGVITGGCNPIPINSSRDGQMIVLQTRELENGVKYF
ncbi:MAG TPA: DUF2318 domain-containing protein [Nitrospirota bacterium]|nr:DUF2318 domain-containing protein [Nitrospirota bacterium]